ncbi:MAG: hypothetical protein MUE42_11155 [Opitutaceae bacterium]|jgi:hypothetical protein|nr:hypothetical protein [Opitutaceae bacterium]
MKYIPLLSGLLFASSLLASAATLAASEAAPAAGASSTYPLTTCVVSGEALGSMGDAYVHLHKETGKPDRKVRLCCKGCLKKFTKDPAKYLGKLDAAAAPAPTAPAASHAGHAH